MTFHSLNFVDYSVFIVSPDIDYRNWKQSGHRELYGPSSTNSKYIIAWLELH